MAQINYYIKQYKQILFMQMLNEALGSKIKLVTTNRQTVSTIDTTNEIFVLIGKLLCDTCILVSQQADGVFQFGKIYNPWKNSCLTLDDSLRKMKRRSYLSLVCTCVRACVYAKRNKYYSVEGKHFLSVGSARRDGKGGCACPERRIASSHWSIRGFHGRESSICSPLTFVSGTEHAPMELGLFHVRAAFHYSYGKRRAKEMIICRRFIFFHLYPIYCDFCNVEESFYRT